MSLDFLIPIYGITCYAVGCLVGYMVARPARQTVNVTMQPISREQVEAIATALRKVTTETFGHNVPPSKGWDLL